MSLYESYEMVCDGDGCYANAERAESERQAEKNAKDEGWEQIGGKWYCEDCARKAKRRRKP